MSVICAVAAVTSVCVWCCRLSDLSVADDTDVDWTQLAKELRR